MCIVFQQDPSKVFSSVAAGNGKCLTFWAHHLLSAFSHLYVIYVNWEKLLLDFFFKVFRSYHSFYPWKHIKSLSWSDLISPRGPREAELHATFLSKPLILGGFDPQHYLLWSHNNKKTKIKKEIKARNIHQWWTISVLHCIQITHSVPCLFQFSCYYDSTVCSFPFFNHRKTLKTKSYARTPSFSSQILVLGSPGLFSEECFERHTLLGREEDSRSQGLTEGTATSQEKEKPARKRELRKTWKARAHTITWG